MFDVEDTALIQKLRFALDTYLDTRRAWKETLESVSQQGEAMGRVLAPTEPSNERGLYRFAQAISKADTAGHLADHEVYKELAHRARRYLTEVQRISSALVLLRQHLEHISGEQEPPPRR